MADYDRSLDATAVAVMLAADIAAEEDAESRRISRDTSSRSSSDTSGSAVAATAQWQQQWQQRGCCVQRLRSGCTTAADIAGVKVRSAAALRCALFPLLVEAARCCGAARGRPQLDHGHRGRNATAAGGLKARGDAADSNSIACLLRAQRRRSC